MKENITKAGYTKLVKIRGGNYILTNKQGKKELWFANKNHASYGIKYKNTHLEFARSI